MSHLFKVLCICDTHHQILCWLCCTFIFPAQVMLLLPHVLLRGSQQASIALALRPVYKSSKLSELSQHAPNVWVQADSCTAFAVSISTGIQVLFAFVRTLSLSRNEFYWSWRFTGHCSRIVQHPSSRRFTWNPFRMSFLKLNKMFFTASDSEYGMNVEFILKSRHSPENDPARDATLDIVRTLHVLTR